MATKLTVREWARYQVELARGFMPAVHRGLKSGAQRALRVVRQSVETAPPASPNGSVGAVDTGDYYRRWKFRMVPNGLEIYNDHPASAVIEHGRRAGAKMPPPSTLVPWLRRRLGIPMREAKDVAFVVARAIGRRGLRARRVLERAVPDMQKAIEQEVRHELDRAVAGKRL